MKTKPALNPAGVEKRAHTMRHSRNVVAVTATSTVSAVATSAFATGMGKSSASAAPTVETTKTILKIKPPNAPAHRPRASDAWLATETQSRGSVQPVC